MNQIKLLDIAAFSPRSLQSPNSWIGHLPFAAWLIQEISPQIFVELGTHTGNSFFSFCQAVEEANLSTQCYAVDTWFGDKQSGLYDEEIFDQVNIHQQDHYAEFSRLLRMTFDDAVSQFTDESIGLLHIDGFHTYGAVRHDFEKWLPKLAPGAIVIFHDTNVKDPYFGVWKLWEELQGLYHNNLEFLHSNGLGVMQLNNAPSDKKLAWLEPNSNEKQTLINYFFELGSRQIERYELDCIKQYAFKRDLVVERLKGRLLKLRQTLSKRNSRIVELSQARVRLGQSVDSLMQADSKNNDKIVNLNQAIVERDLQIAGLIQAVADRDYEITALRNSTSWQITKPLRIVSHHFIQKYKLSPIHKLGLLNRLAKLERFSYQKLAYIQNMLPDDFDTQMYLQLNPDLVETGTEPIAHYLRHGRHEGRIYYLPELYAMHKFKADQETILVVSHEASRTGAPVLALNVVQELVLRYNVVALLLNGGPLVDAFNLAASAVVTANDRVDNQTLVRYLCERANFKFAIVNTIESREVLPSLGHCLVPTISLIHEFASYTRPIDAFEHAFFWSSAVVFSAKIVLENVIDKYPHIEKLTAHVLPQGRCSLPLEEFDEERLHSEREGLRGLIRPKNIAEDSLIVLGAGFVQLRKGVDLFIECAARVLRTPEGRRCRFVWIGKGYIPERDTRYSVYLEDQVHRAGIQDHVFFIDETAAIETAYEEADLFLLSSRLDPMPNVAIDAMAHGVPVLCFDKTTGIADFLVDCGLQNHCVAEYLDTDDMANKILALVNSQTLREQVASQCQDTSISYFNMKKYSSQLISLSQGVCDLINREKEDAELILSSDLFRKDFAGRLDRQDQSSQATIRVYVRSWTTGLGRRKPFPGFHPGIYLEQHGVSEKGVDPFADYLRRGSPQGPWNYNVIIPEKIKGKDLPKDCNVALHLHIYYTELLSEITERLSRNRICPDLFISVVNEKDRDLVLEDLKNYKGKIIEIQVVPNRGRDIGPLFSAFGKGILANYDFVGHLHTKKSIDVKDADIGKSWFWFLLENLLGGDSGAMADCILAKMNNDNSIGMVFPDDPNIICWDANRAIADMLAGRIGLQKLPEQFVFPIGTMFWAKTSALKPWMELNLDWNDYPEEPLPYDGTLLHAIERLLSLSISLSNFTLRYYKCNWRDAMKIAISDGCGFIDFAITNRSLKDEHDLSLFERPQVALYHSFSDEEYAGGIRPAHLRLMA